ncbi:hypothetical protein [Gilvimarinus chinensis]|uniref:hypothetical protein n=1 Tax=Gilvimarinus chinensis TaxID=396005 RepID=UPI00036D157A|nr:hypothetical protein [Gilvimarinus chinensis]
MRRVAPLLFAGSGRLDPVDPINNRAELDHAMSDGYKLELESVGPTVLVFIRRHVSGSIAGRFGLRVDQFSELAAPIFSNKQGEVDHDC